MNLYHEGANAIRPYERDNYDVLTNPENPDSKLGESW